jgi:hypothetical protein
MLGSGSCAHNDDMLVVIGAMSAQAPDCNYQPSATSDLLLKGTVDVAFGANYKAVLLVANQLRSQGSKARLRAESSNININNAEVRLLSNGTDEMQFFSVPASGYIAVGSGEDSGYGGIAIDILPGGVNVPATTQFIVAEIQLQGTTLGGESIDSNVFRFEIVAVNSALPSGGLVSYTALDANGECSSAVCTATTTTTSCYLGQDAPISCCECLALSFCRIPPT